MLKGRKHAEESKRKMKKPKKDSSKMYKIPKGKHISSKTEFKKGRKLTKEMKLKISNSLRGKKNPNWKGGITSLLNRLRHIENYYQWRSNIFSRDNWTCQTCNQRGGDLEPHHIISFSKLCKIYNIENEEVAKKCPELWDITNGITLCKKCHKLTKNWGKRNG